VNLSPRQLIDAGMAEQVIGLLARRGVPADRLVLEVTESALLEGGPVVEELAALHAAGVRIALDDFGTGYSSLTHLRTLPVSLLKLDRAFLATLGDDQASAALVASVVALAHALDMPAVAEGVETPEQAALLLELGCDLGQGWWFGHAEPPTARVAAARRADRA
jgi:EAL domain-containing protein (putative c-di-GMP-specific phosphodiesterase class I)